MSGSGRRPGPVPDAVRNEQTKLLATALNTAATSSFTVGVLAPIAAAVYTTTSPVSLEFVITAAAIWIIAAVLLHLLARRVLRSLRP